MARGEGSHDCSHNRAQEKIELIFNTLDVRGSKEITVAQLINFVDKV